MLAELMVGVHFAISLLINGASGWGTRLALSGMSLPFLQALAGVCIIQRLSSSLSGFSRTGFGVVLVANKRRDSMLVRFANRDTLLRCIIFSGRMSELGRYC